MFVVGRSADPNRFTFVHMLTHNLEHLENISKAKREVCREASFDKKGMCHQHIFNSWPYMIILIILGFCLIVVAKQ